MVWLVGVLVHQLVFRDVWPEVPASDAGVVGVVWERVDQTGTRQRVRVRMPDLPGLVQVEVGPYPRLQVGDRVHTSCTLQPIRDLAVEVFRYDRYLAKERVYAVCRGRGTPRIVGVTSSWRRTFATMRDGVAHRIQTHIPEPHASLLIGLLYGARSTLPDEVREAFRRTGTMHIVAVSGFNVMIVSKVLLLVLTATILRRQQAFLLVLFGVVCFVVFAGADAAVVRAGVMGGLTLVASHIGRPRVSSTLLLVAASIMVAFQPRILLDDVGFQLSFAASLGLLYLGPRIQRFCVFVPRTFGLRGIFAETLAATCATMPISLWQFKTLSWVAPVANLFVVPWILWAMMLGVFGYLATFLSDTLATWAFVPATLVLETMLVFVRIFAPLPIISFL